MNLVSRRHRLAVLAVSFGTALGWGLQTSAAPGDGAKAPRIYFGNPITPESAATWTMLQKKTAFRFEQPVSFEDLLKAIIAMSSDKDGKTLKVFVDPVGLQEASRSMDSKVVMNVANVRIGTGLQAALDQLDLAYSVNPQGFVTITSAASIGADDESNTPLLDRLDTLEKGMAELRAAIRAQRPNK